MSCDEYNKEFLPDLSYLIARCYCSSGRLRMELDEVCRLAARSEAGCAGAQVQQVQEQVIPHLERHNQKAGEGGTQ